MVDNHTVITRSFTWSPSTAHTNDETLLVLTWPVQQLVGLLIALLHWISHWPAVQLLTGHPQPWVLLMAFGLIPWIINSHQ